jgi:hypothetical protein
MTGAPFGRMVAESMVQLGVLINESTETGVKYADCDLTFLLGCQIDIRFYNELSTHMQLNRPNVDNNSSADLQLWIIAHGEPRLNVDMILAQ